jgi:hypothetical protein
MQSSIYGLRKRHRTEIVKESFTGADCGRCMLGGCTSREQKREVRREYP